MLRDWLYRVYEIQQRLIAPKLRSAQDLYAEVLAKYVDQKTTWLDIGCGHQVFPDWLGEQEKRLLAATGRIVGLDLDLPSLLAHRGIREKLMASSENMPFGDGVFSLVTANMVVEHIENPAAALKEIHRVLQGGGLFVFHTPNLRHYKTFLASFLPSGSVKNRLIYLLEARKEEDAFPTHYRLNTSADIRSQAIAREFEVAELIQVNTVPVTQLLGPLATVELLLVRLLDRPALRDRRSNLICVLRKPDICGANHG
jgi:ubiquinone/menaquinone biosynthesis C-methylase UbiE